MGGEKSMRWNQKGMAVCLIFFAIIIGLVTVEFVKQNNKGSDSAYSSEEDILSLSGEPEKGKGPVTGAAVTPTKEVPHAAGMQKVAEEKGTKTAKPSIPVATANADTDKGKKKKAEKNTEKHRQENSKNGKNPKKSKGNTNRKKKDIKKAVTPTATPVPKPVTAPPTQPTVQLEIQCKAILDKKDLWRQGIEEIIPHSGVFYSGVCSIHEGETVYDLLKRVCQEQKIALDCSYTPIYGSYYVRGIGNLYEFDCGSESGWKYRVNGITPGVGASQYTLQSQDKVVFAYEYEL